MRCFLILFYISKCVLLCSAAKSVQVKTPNGLVRGLEQITDDNVALTYYAFKGIRYGTANRFEAPQPVKPWTGVYNAITDGNTCIQVTSNVTSYIPFLASEDCLFINVYTPKLPLNNTTRLPVMVWVYGGFFQFGDSRYVTYGPDYFMSHDVVIVTLNYRLNIFGFLSTGDDLLSGNWALKDIILALNWVKKMISSFGGDPNNVTIFGQSAGAALISYVAQSPLVKDKGLFHRAIFQSGTSLHPWALNRDPRDVFNKISLKVGCNVYRNDKNIIDCLRRTSVNVLRLAAIELFAVDSIYRLMIFDSLAFTVNIEPDGPNAAVTEKSYQLLKAGKMPQVPILVGGTSEESLFVEIVIRLLQVFFTQADVNIALLVPADMCASSYNATAKVGPAVRNYYFGRNVLFSSLYSKLKFISDDLWNKSMRKFIELTGKHTPTYCYVFSYEGMMGMKKSIYPGVGHAEDVQYLFRTSASKNRNFPENDFLVRSMLLKMWTSFAKNGVPSGSTLKNKTWPAVYAKTTDTECVDINLTPQIIKNPFELSQQMWQKLYDIYGIENCHDTW